MLPIQKKISPYNHYNYNDPKYIVIHYIGATGTAKNNADYFYGGDRQASAHFYIGETECWQGTEIHHGAWHVGNTKTEVNNQNSIGIEMECANPQLFVTDKTIQNTCELVVYLMKQYNIPIQNIRTHYEVSGKTKVCPNFANSSRWTDMKNKIVSLYNGESTPSSQTPVDTVYRVRKTWADAKSQIFASKTFEGAKAQCKTGYSVFDEKGKCLYTNAPTPSTDEVKRYSEKGVFYPNTTIYFRNAPSTNSAYPTQGNYTKGESVAYDVVVIGQKYNWISWISASSGIRRYLPIKDKVTGESWGTAV